VAAFDVENSSTHWLVAWLEPLGEDRWLRPGEKLHFRTDYVGEDAPFAVDYWANDEDHEDGIANINVVHQFGRGVEVTDMAGNAVECGYQRPEEIEKRWQAAMNRPKA